MGVVRFDEVGCSWNLRKVRVGQKLGESLLDIKKYASCYPIALVDTVEFPCTVDKLFSPPPLSEEKLKLSDKRFVGFIVEVSQRDPYRLFVVVLAKLRDCLGVNSKTCLVDIDIVIGYHRLKGVAKEPKG